MKRRRHRSRKAIYACNIFHYRDSCRYLKYVVRFPKNNEKICMWTSCQGATNTSKTTIQFLGPISFSGKHPYNSLPDMDETSSLLRAKKCALCQTFSILALCLKKVGFSPSGSMFSIAIKSSFSPL